MIFFFEIDHHQDVRDQDGDETGERRAGDAESGPRANSEDQQRREHDVEQDTEHLQSDGGFDDSGRAQRRPQRDQGKLEDKRGNKPKQVTLGQRRRGRIGTERFAIRVAQQKSANAQDQSNQDRHDTRLVEDELGARLIFSAGRLRDEGCRSHTQHLGQGENNHHQVPGYANCGDRFLAEMPHPVKIGQKIKRLHRHAHGHECRHMQ